MAKSNKGGRGFNFDQKLVDIIKLPANFNQFKTNLFKLNLQFISQRFCEISRISPKITKIFVYVWVTSSKLVIELKIIRIVFPKSIGVTKDATLRVPQRSNASSYNPLFFKLIISERLFCCSCCSITFKKVFYSQFTHFFQF